MIEAFVLLTVEVGKVEGVIKNIMKKLPAVKEAKGVTGPYGAYKRDCLQHLQNRWSY